LRKAVQIFYFIDGYSPDRRGKVVSPVIFERLTNPDRDTANRRDQLYSVLHPIRGEAVQSRPVFDRMRLTPGRARPYLNSTMRPTERTLEKCG
jgi:hypothetical protein